MDNKNKAISLMQSNITLCHTTVKSDNNEELFNLVKRAISMQSVKIIITPRVDVASNAYYWIGVRFENRELDFKLGVNSEIRSYIRAYLVGGNHNELPKVTNYQPDNVSDVETWLSDNLNFHANGAIKSEEIISMRDGTDYQYKQLTLINGKIIYPATKLDDVLSLFIQTA